MTPKEYTIKKFETNYPELVELIDIWADHSIEQNWDELTVLLNQHTVPDCPPDEYCNKVQGNKRYLFFIELSKKVAEYLMAQGYNWTMTTQGQLISPEGKYVNGYIIKARMATIEEKNNLK